MKCDLSSVRAGFRNFALFFAKRSAFVWYSVVTFHPLRDISPLFILNALGKAVCIWLSQYYTPASLFINTSITRVGNHKALAAMTPPKFLQLLLAKINLHIRVNLIIPSPLSYGTRCETLNQVYSIWRERVFLSFEVQCTDLDWINKCCRFWLQHKTHWIWSIQTLGARLSQERSI